MNDVYREEKKSSPGYFVSLKVIVVVGFLIVAILVGSILGTYFGKVCKDCDKILPSRCQQLYCDNSSIIEDWGNNCPLATISTEISSSTTPPEVVEYRLPDSIRPYRYELTIKPYFSTLTQPEVYDGQIMIFFSVFADTSKFTFHSVGLEIDFSTALFESLTDPDEFKSTNFTDSYNSLSGFMTLTLNTEVFKTGHNYTFFVEFKGFPKDNNVGFYRSSYIDSEGNRKYLMASQLSYIEARKSFPCFDEPTFKAVFKTKIIHDSSLHAISNMPVKSRTDLPASDDGFNWVETEFDDTIKMSTYLIGILLSDFYCTQVYEVDMPLSENNVDVRICARPTAADDLVVARDSALSILPTFEEYFNFPFPLPKLDHSSVPTFKFGAMENWGLILYLENSLHYNDKTSTLANEINIIRVMAHEVAHMWFGNLVTHKWWNDIFLKEGFARYYEYRGSDMIRPTWRMMDRYHELLLGIIQSDSTDFTREITLDVNSPEEIDSQYNGVITYGKGSAVVKMAAYILGEETFKKALYKYFVKFQLSNVDQYDLWNILYEEALEEDRLKDVNFTAIMSSWTKQKGHPVVTVRRMGNNRIGVTQNRFITDTTVNVALLRDIKWYIPFTYSIERIGSLNSFTNQVDQTNLFNEFHFINPDTLEEIITFDEDLGDDDFIIANLDMAGFYRVQYDEANWRLIIRQLNEHIDQLSPRTRSSLISDIFSLTEAGYFDKPIAFDLSSYLAHEFDFLPWSAFISRIKFYTDLFESTSNFKPIQAFLRDLVKPYYTKLGWIENIETDLWTDRVIRNSLIGFACRRDLPECTDQANGYFKQWQQTGESDEILRGLRSLVMCVGVYQGSENDFNYVFDQVTTTTDITLRNDLIAGLACSKDPLLQLSLLDFQLKANTSDILAALVNVANRPGGFVTSWNYLKANWDYLYSNYNTSANFATLIRDISLRMKYNYELDDFANFFGNKQLSKTISDTVEEAISRVNSNINWFVTNSEMVLEWFNEQGSTKKSI